MADDSQHAAASLDQTEVQDVQGDESHASLSAPIAAVPECGPEQQQQQQQLSEYDQQQQQQYYEQQQELYQQQLLQSSGNPSAADLERIKLFVGNFPPHVTDLDLAAMCGQFAPIAGDVLCLLLISIVQQVFGSMRCLTRGVVMLQKP
jgi:hypothetical protein